MQTWAGRVQSETGDNQTMTGGEQSRADDARTKTFEICKADAVERFATVCLMKGGRQVGVAERAYD